MYEFKIEYISTTNFGYADVLSRLINEHVNPDEEFVIASIQVEDDIDRVQDDVLQKLPVTHTMIENATQQSHLLQEVIQNVQNGWPSVAKIDDSGVRSFYKHKDGLYISNGCLMYGERIIVPHKYRSRILQQLHKGHQGMQRMKSIARAYVFWPGMDAQIEDLVKSCNKCASTAKSPTKVHLESWKTPNGPWERVHIDYAGPMQGTYFLVVIDAYSKWPEILATTSTTTSKTIQLLETVFSRFGLPQTLVSDNGTQFVSSQFELFCQQNGIEHIRTAPYHPQSNGQAERFVDTLKRSLQKNQGEGGLQDALQVFLSTYRSTPNPNAPMQKSPAEIMLGWKIRTPLDLLKPKVQHSNESGGRQQIQNKQFNEYHKSKDRKFHIGDTVDVKVYSNNKFRWSTGSVKERIGKVMYSVQLQDSNRTIRSHANQMRLRPNQHPVEEVDMELPLDIICHQHKQQPPSQLTLPVHSEQDSEENTPTPIRRSARERRKPERFRDFHF